MNKYHIFKHKYNTLKHPLIIKLIKTNKLSPDYKKYPKNSNKGQLSY